MTCPECGSDCSRDSVDVGVGLITEPWICDNCSWTEDNGYPLNNEDWEKFLNEGKIGLCF